MQIYSRKIVVPLLAIGALLLMILWMSGMFRDLIEPGLVPQDVSSVTQVMSIEEQKVLVFETVPATISARDTTNISSRIIARIGSVNVRAGAMVSKGQLLIQLEQSDLQAKVAQSVEQVNLVSVRLAEAEKNLERATELSGKGILTQADFDKTLADVDALQAMRESAQQALAESRSHLRYTEIRALIDGRIVDRFAEPGDTATPGMKLLSIYNPLSLQVEAWVREHLALTLKLGQPLEVVVPALGVTEIATIDERVPAADPGSRSFLIRASMSWNDQLLPGMYAEVKIPYGDVAQMLIPEQAITTIGQLHRVSVISNDVVEWRFVRVGRKNKAGERVVISGLVPGEIILVPD